MHHKSYEACNCELYSRSNHPETMAFDPRLFHESVQKNEQRLKQENLIEGQTLRLLRPNDVHNSDDRETEVRNDNASLRLNFYRSRCIFRNNDNYYPEDMSVNVQPESNFEEDNTFDLQSFDLQLSEAMNAKTPPRKRLRKDAYDTSLVEILANLEQSKMQENDDDKMFLLSLLSSIKKMSEDLKLATKIEILQVICFVGVPRLFYGRCSFRFCVARYKRTHSRSSRLRKFSRLASSSLWRRAKWRSSSGRPVSKTGDSRSWTRGPTAPFRTLNLPSNHNCSICTNKCCLLLLSF